MVTTFSSSAWFPTWLLGLALAFYAIAWSFLWQRARHVAPAKSLRVVILVLVTIGLIAHSAGLYAKLFASQSAAGLTLATSLSLVAWMAVVLYLMATVFRAMLNLGLAVLPAVVITLLVVIAASSLAPQAISSEGNAIGYGLPPHLMIAVLTFGVLSLASAQAALVIMQEHQLRQHMGNVPDASRNGFFFPALPPLQRMESLLFGLLLLGFILLTTSLMLGVYAARNMTDSALPFNHHTLLSVLAWLGFGAILLGHWLRGWRGQQAAKYTMIGFGVFVLAYFGPRVVRELIL